MEPTSTIAIFITLGPNGADYNVHSRRAYHTSLNPPARASWDRIADGMLTQLVHDPAKFEETALLADSARYVRETTDRNKDSAFDRESGLTVDNVVLFPTNIE